jgi:hypothetical protein
MTNTNRFSFVLFITFIFVPVLANASTNVYYSVGQNTSDHKTGSPLISIANGVATFSVAQTATNMGIGDKVTYNTNTIAYISGKVSTSVWNVITATGGTPADISNSTVVSIVHPFSSLSTAISQSSQSSFLNTNNLVTGNYILNLPLYYDSGADTTSVTIQGYTTGASNYINIYTPTNTSTQVNQSQRHSGVWDTSKFRIIPSSNPFQATIEVNQAYTHLDGLQVSPWNAANRNGINITADYVYISNTIVKGGGSDNAGIRFDTGVNSAGYIYNTIIYDLGLYGIYEALAAGPYFYVYNVTIHNCPSSIVSYGSSMVAKNVLSYASTQGFVGTYSATSTNNASNLASNSQGSNPRDSVTVTFIDEAGDNFHISSSDTGVLNRGATLSSDPYFSFSTDIDLSSRNGIWDIGADEYIDTTPPSSPTSLSANVISSNEIDLSWASSTDDVSVSGYVVYRDSNPIASTTMKSYSDTGLSQNTSYTYGIMAYDSSNNYSSLSSTLSTSTLADITAPVLSSGSPTGTLDPQTTSTSLTLITNENATCRYSTQSNTSYDSMTSNFSQTLSTSHSVTVSGLTDGSSNIYYVRCVDAYGNKNSSDYTITFSIGISASANNDYYSWSNRLE